VFCRIVLIYFDESSKAHVTRRLLEHLAPGGYLFLGHAESVGRTDPPTRGVAPNVYALAAAS
jgi:chemotaxis protein methyltransferase CheR